MKTIWIIGTGRFGRLAIERLAESDRPYRFVLVDEDGKGFELIAGPNRTLERVEGIGFVERHLTPENGPDWIVPSLPVHLAAEWCIRRLADSNRQRIPIPAGVPEITPNAMKGLNGDIYVTHATFLCPDNCPEPAKSCSVTGKQRPENMFDLLQKIRYPEFTSLVIRSHQLAPGVGGYRPAQLFDLLAAIRQTPGKVLVSTACRCHGVMTGISAREL